MIKLLFLLFALNLFASQFVEIKISKLHGLISFSESIMKTNYSLKSFQNIYNANYKKDDLSKKNLELLHKSYLGIRTKRIYNYKRSSNLYQMIKIESSFEENLDTLKSLAISFKTAASNEDIDNYFKSLKYFLPIYEKLIWNQNIQKLTFKSKEIQNLMDSSKYDNLILKAATFYGVDIDKIDKIYLSLYPIPSGDKTLAFMLGNVESIGVLVNKPKSNIAWLLSATIFHEIAHTLYDNNKKNLMNLFENTTHKSSQKVKEIFNESMATALGAGWAFFHITGGMQSNGRWYNNKEYDRFAKKIYPIVNDYINNNRKIDEDFIKKIIEIY